MFSRTRPSSQSYQVAAVCGFPAGLTVPTTAGLGRARKASSSGGTGRRGTTASLARAGGPLLGPALEAGVRLPERHRLLVRGHVLARVGELGERVRDELLLARAALHRFGPVEQGEAELRQVAAHVLEDAEVDQRQPLGGAPLELVERLLPGLDVHLRRRG